MRGAPFTLDRFILEEQRFSPGSTGELSLLLLRLGVAAKRIAAALAGRWVGEYSSEATGRTGSIVFELKSGEKVARGDVLMVPRGVQDPSVIPQVLNINFVNAAGGVLRGTMDPYTDPTCDCQVQTTFVGRQSGDTIEGTFTTTPSGNAPITTGRWKVARQKKK